MTTSFTLTIDCADADQMMEFWTTALGYKPKDPPEGFLRVGGGLEVPVALRKQRVEAEVDRLIRVGATRLRTFDEVVADRYFVVMQDPEGNEFCLS